MAKLLLNVLKLSPVVLAATFFVSNGAFAAEQNMTSVDELAQVTSVDQLSDIEPSHWAFQSVKSLVERYGCVAGYPDRTYRGNRSMTRYEFAALLNGCLDRITQLIAASGGNNNPDMAAVNKLREEFEGELATLRGKVDGLDYRVGELEGANKFSTTAKLKGKVEFITGGVFGPNDKVGSTAGSNDFEDQITFGQRTRLDITSSFTGKDKLRVRLHQRDNQSYGSDRTGTNMSRIDVQGDTDGFVEVEKLNYNFKPSKNISASVWALGAGMDDFLDSDKAKVQTTRFAKRNPFT
ncbi:MAG: iron uptake porin, partial [Cyanobacteria bacterium J06633_8]